MPVIVISTGVERGMRSLSTGDSYMVQCGRGGPKHIRPWGQNSTWTEVYRHTGEEVMIFARPCCVAWT